MGPWYHGEWASPDGDRLGNVNFNAKTAQYYRDNLELPFLKHYLKDDPAKDKLDIAEANVFRDRHQPCSGGITMRGRRRPRRRRRSIFTREGSCRLTPLPRTRGMTNM